MDIALLIARLIIGLGLAAHGSQKLFGWFGGYGIKGTGGWLESIGFRPGPLFAAASGLGEFGGGLLVALGLFGAVGPALIVMVMLVAILTVHIKNGFFQSNNGMELTLVNIAGALLIAFGGAGAYSLDALFGITLFAGAKIAWILMAIAIILALLNLAARRAPAETPAT